MVILFDADGVLFDTEYFQQRKKIVEYFAKKNKSIIDPNGYGIKDVYGCTSDEEIKCWIKNIIDYSYFFDPRPDMSIMIKRLQDEGHKVYCVTSKACSLEKSIKGVGVRKLFETGLKKHNIHFDDIYYCSLENSAHDKKAVCQKLKCDIFIEDSVQNIEELKKVTKVLCMNTKNNTLYYDKDVIRVYSADDIYREIKKYESLLTGITNVFSRFEILSKNQKMTMSKSDLKEYYKQYKEYLLHLPFDINKKNEQEKNYLILSSIIAPFFNKKYHCEVIGLENIPLNTNYIITSNHLCNKDMLLLATAFKNKPWHSLNRIEDFDGIVGTILKKIGATFVDRKSPISRHLSTCQMLKKAVNNEVNLIFPEATYNRTNNLLAPFQGKSEVYISQIANIPILPVAITNNYENGQKTVVRIGEKIDFNQDDDINMASDFVYDIMADLVEKNRQYTKKIKG